MNADMARNDCADTVWLPLASRTDAARSTSDTSRYLT
jgi:hypothetical protein